MGSCYTEHASHGAHENMPVPDHGVLGLNPPGWGLGRKLAQ